MFCVVSVSASVPAGCRVQNPNQNQNAIPQLSCTKTAHPNPQTQYIMLFTDHFIHLDQDLI